MPWYEWLGIIALLTAWGLGAIIVLLNIGRDIGLW